MTTSLEARQRYFRDLLQKEPKSKKVLFYKEERREFPIYDIDMEFLLFNQHNGRLETEMLTWQAETGLEAQEYDDEVHNKIRGFLWDVNPKRNKETQADLAEKGQLEPGITTMDGVIIDGNRRAMLLQRMNKSYLTAVVLPDAYDENEKEIVKLETQYQLGEDPKLGYGPIEKYLHAKRLGRLRISEPEKLMSLNRTEFQKLLGIMELMDEYLTYIRCAGLYNLLKDGKGTKEGMFVDLYADIKKFENGNSMVQWDFDTELDVNDLLTIQFDHIRYGGSELVGTGKEYRRISHSSSEKKNCFFAHENIWSDFAENHRENVNSIAENLPSLDEFHVTHRDDYATRIDAAKALTAQWREAVGPKLQRNFGISNDRLSDKSGEIEPNRLLKRAISALESIDIDAPEFLANIENESLVDQINRRSYEMRKIFKKSV